VGEFQIWHHHRSEFPIATVRPRRVRARVIAMLGELQRWLVSRWDWFKPRTVPVIVAALGMIFVLASADYLARAHGQKHQQVDTLFVRLR
jgi:hypothetical protein